MKRITLDEAMFKNLVAGKAVVLLTPASLTWTLVDGVEIILSDIGWSVMAYAIDEARTKATRS